MNTRDVAEQLGTDAKTLRRFLRHPSSTFAAVGSGARYEFTEKDLPTLKRRFTEWMANQSTPRTVKVDKPTHTTSRRMSQPERDQAIWEEEGEVTLPDIRNPHVRASVRLLAEERARRLDELLLSRGLHISQWRDREIV